MPQSSIYDRYIIIKSVFISAIRNSVSFVFCSSGMFDVQILFDLYMEYLSVVRVYRLIKEVKN